MPASAEPRPLTKRQQDLVTTAEYQGIALAAARKFAASAWARAARLDFDTLWSECQVALCVAARKYDPVKYRDVPFGAFLWVGLKRWARGLRYKAFRDLLTNRQMPVAEGDWGGAIPVDVPDHRRADGEGVCPLLRAWCSPDYAVPRRRIHMRYRVILYLRYVECMTLDEVGLALAVSRERVRQIEADGMRLLSVSRPRSARNCRTLPRKG